MRRSSYSPTRQKMEGIGTDMITYQIEIQAPVSVPGQRILAVLQALFAPYFVIRIARSPRCMWSFDEPQSTLRDELLPAEQREDWVGE